MATYLHMVKKKIPCLWETEEDTALCMSISLMARDEESDQDRIFAIVIVVLCNDEMQTLPLYMKTVSRITFWFDLKVIEGVL